MSVLKFCLILAQSLDNKLKMTFLVYRQEVIKILTEKPYKLCHINIINSLYEEL